MKLSSNVVEQIMFGKERRLLAIQMHTIMLRVMVRDIRGLSGCTIARYLCKATKRISWLQLVPTLMSRELWLVDRLLLHVPVTVPVVIAIIVIIECGTFAHCPSSLLIGPNP